MNKIHNEIIDIVSQYEISINELLYGKHISLYRTFELYQSYDAKLVKPNLLKLLSDEILYIDGKNFNHKESFFNQEFEYHNLLGLTLKGGNLWEQIFQPNWINYIDVYYEDKSYTEPVTIELTSMNKALLLDICQHLNQDKLIIETLDEWEICYWKKVQDVDIFKFTYIAETIDEKILIDNIYSDLHSYQNLFCKNTEHFF